MPFDLIGSACFVCESDQYLGEIGRLKTSDCPRCSPTIALDLTQGQRVLDHIGAHILFDAAVINSQSPLCGLCLRPSPLCQMFLSKGKGGNRNLQIDQKLSRGCLMKVKYSYSTAAKSTPSSPCSNVPVQCPICPKSEPAIWRYFLKVHFQEKHEQLLVKHEHLWKLSNFERTEMKKIWAKRSKVPVKRTKKSKVPPLVISESHRAQIPTTYFILIAFLKKRFSLHVHISVTTQTSQKSRKTGILTTMIPAIPSQSLMKMGRTHAWRDTTAMGKLQVAIITTWKEYREIY